MPAPDRPPPTPRWVKISLAAAGLVLIVVAILLMTGHGPGRHFKQAEVAYPAISRARS